VLVTKVKTFNISSDNQPGFFIVKVETDEGIYGLGEIGIRNWSGSIQYAIDQLSHLYLIGQNPFSTERIWQQMFRGGFFPADSVYSCAISALDIALWDIKGKSLNMPLYELLGGPTRDKVIVYPHNNIEDVDLLVEDCKSHVSEGWRFLRWGVPGTDPKDPSILDPVKAMDLTEQQIASVREAVGYDVHICLDFHTRLDTADSIALCKRLEKYRPFFIEDPIRSENPSSYRTLARHVSLPIAAGEQWSSKWPFREVIEEELISYARIDLCIVGGITEALKIAHWCETHYIDIVPHNPLGPVSAAACVNLCMAVSNVGVQEMPKRPGSYANDIFPTQMEWNDGYVRNPGRPGLGVDFDEDLANSKSSSHDFSWRPPQMRRSDGSFTNW
tara:strand:- start:14105 stop:15265 length:1161 start_codon:yes stop_codon:yes gene_type:complete